MNDAQLVQRLESVARRVRGARVWLTLAAVWLIAAIAGAGLLVVGYQQAWQTLWVAPWLAVGAMVVGLICAWFAWRSARDFRWLARKIESAYPDLNSSLLTAVELQPDLPHGHYSYLQREVLKKAHLHGYRNDQWKGVVPKSRFTAAHVLHAASLLLLVGVLLGLVLLKKPAAAAPPGTAFADVEVDLNPNFAVVVEPGNTEVERGASLLVLARFQGAFPPEAALVYTAEGEEERRIPMSKSLDDPMFGGRIAAVDAPLGYRVEYAEQSSPTYRVGTFEYPQLIQADARLVFPSYTSLPEKFVQDVRRLSAVEGTELTLICRLNKSVTSAQLVDGDGETIELVASDEPSHTYEAQLTFDRSRRFTLALTDSDGRQNQSPPEFVIKVLPNSPPDLKLVLPTRDVQVSPIEELDLQASAWDDYGLARVGLSFAMPGSQSKEVVLGESLPAKSRLPMVHLLAFEELQAQPDQLLSYYFWAEDIGPDGEVRRTSSDMYFAEVRHFEEIFRQGQQPTEEEMQQRQQQQQQGQSGQNAQQAEQLAELQKQIISGTWKVIRRETRDEPTAEFAADVQLLLESQQSALAQAEELAQNVEDDESLEHVEAVQQHMQQAIEQLAAAGSGRAIAPLEPALLSEQSAYQALLRLRAREHEVVRTNQQQQQSQSQSSQSSANSRSQQQLQNLELREDENRYETEQTSPLNDSQQSQEQQEDRQVLNRLRELSQRQSDLNKRIKELQSALEAAETSEEQEEIERRLKRLRDEQEQILRDTEELQQRMDQPENQERMAQQREQLEQARENARQSSEALEEGMVSQAAAEGTRAERELRDLQNEFQRRTANQFSESMREMQQQARELETAEQELSQRLEEIAQNEDSDSRNNSLRDEDDREQIAQQLQQQEERVEDLLNRMRETIEEAESDEPLLAEKLYESIRETRRQSPQEDLENARQSLERGFVDDARQREQRAREGITQLREGVDQAAESILGDDTEALRRARDEIERLRDELNDEIARADQPGGQSPQGEPQQGEQANNPRGGPSQNSEEEPQESEPGEPRQGGSEQGEPQEGESQQGEPQEGESPQGEPSNSGRGQQGNQPSDQQPQQGEPTPQQTGNQPPRDQEGQPRGSGQQRPNGQTQRGGDDRNPSPGGGLQRFLDRGSEPLAPISGEDYLDWSDRLRDVEEMISDPELRAEAARIRQEAKDIRKDVKRNSEPPSWEVVREMVAEPLAELEKRVAEELLRRTSKEALVPIDRDPVPPKFQERVQRYYERLGSGASSPREAID